jgi:hypothetical protein
MPTKPPVVPVLSACDGRFGIGHVDLGSDSVLATLLAMVAAMVCDQNSLDAAPKA